MKKEINILEALEGTPRPHHLIGQATYEHKDQEHILRGTIHFSSEIPSIGDRNENYLPRPHVNAGDVLYAVWNGAHIIGNQLDYSLRTLVNEITVIPHQIVPPDTNLDLEVRVMEESHNTDGHGKPYSLGRIEGNIYQECELLAEVHADAFVRK